MIDVRAPVEFLQGSLPGSHNFPIMNDDERAAVGTEYKVKGSEAAVRLGHQLVSGVTKEQRIEGWCSFIKKHPSAILYCFRGGQRSQISQDWLHQSGVEIARLKGGYKVARQFLIDQMSQFSERRDFLPLAGPTGSGKTILIQELTGIYPAFDLEFFARHRGSAFGATEIAQPTQIDFENQIALAMLRIQNGFAEKIKPLVEDESRLIGKCVVPGALFEKINSSPAVLIDEKIERRVENIYDDYIINSAIKKGTEQAAIEVFAKYRRSLIAISKKLGGVRTKEVLDLLQASQEDFLSKRNLDANRGWIEKLLVYYYDPLYLSSLERRQIQFVFRGSRRECFDYLSSGGK